MTLKAPFPYFGGKSRVAPIVWDAFGGVRNYVEPFFGSGAVLLARPDWQPGMTETVNDMDGYLCNFWRAIQHDPEQTAHYADWPVSELDLHARHKWLIEQRPIVERLRAEPDYFDVKIAGYWVWGLCAWIGPGWTFADVRQLPHLGDAGVGINRRLPYLGDAGRGKYIRDYFAGLSARLRDVRVACGDWRRVLGERVTFKNGGMHRGGNNLTATFLDPPYAATNRATVYDHDNASVAHDVAEWCRANENNPKLRIVLAGYEGDYDLPGWYALPWKANGGYGSQGNGRGRENAGRERLWFSPHCIQRQQETQTALAV